MANIFSLAEAIDVGIEKEKKRRDFYALVAGKFENAQMKKLFIQLRDWEAMHVKKFTEIRGKAIDLEAAQSYPGEMEAYMQVFVDDKLYNDISADMFADTVKQPRDAINRGIHFEKDAILFFSELLPYVHSQHKEVIKELIDEEKKHLVYLAQLKKTLDV